NLLLMAGWCHGGIHWLRNRCSNISMFYFIAFFDQFILERDHGNCTSEFCMADVIYEDTYITKHIKPCLCPHIGTEVGDDIVQILENGEIPVLSVVSSFSGIHLVAKSTKDVDFYIAISHVWSDGLGNPRS